ncbi:MAG: hypothetical protein QM535_21170 [Limnohabitans sp.]|nr:hypothetical protein [Limnohabitans sp.]
MPDENNIEGKLATDAEIANADANMKADSEQNATKYKVFIMREDGFVVVDTETNVSGASQTDLTLTSLSKDIEVKITGNYNRDIAGSDNTDNN